MAFFIYTARLIEAKRAKCKIENTQYWTPLIRQETSTISSIAFYLQMEIQRTCTVQQSYMTVNKMSCKQFINLKLNCVQLMFTTVLTGQKSNASL